MKKSELTRWIGLGILLVVCLLDGYLSNRVFDYTTAFANWTLAMWAFMGIATALLVVGVVLVVFSFKMAKKEKLQEQNKKNDSNNNP